MRFGFLNNRTKKDEEEQVFYDDEILRTIIELRLYFFIQVLFYCYQTSGWYSVSL